jgi:hypothetical protein
MGALYWERHPDGPFATLIAVATSWLHPEIDDLDGLKRFAKSDGIDKSLVFKSELRQALLDPALLPDGELFKSVQYENGCAEAFLIWLWHELYGDEPFAATALTRPKALPEPFAGRLQWPTAGSISRAVRVGGWDKAVEMLLAGLAESNALVSPVEREELAGLLSAIGQPAAAVTALRGIAAGSTHRTAKETRDVVLLGAASQWPVRNADRDCDNLPRPGELQP